MCFKVFLNLLIIILCVRDISNYKILGVFPMGAPSHYFLGNELMKGLAEAGHDVTMLTVFEEKNPPKNGKYKQIVMKEVYEKQQVIFKSKTNLTDNESSVFSNPVSMIFLFNMFATVIGETILADSQFQDFIKTEQTFDVVIVPQFHLDHLKALAPYFGAHLVIFNSVAANSWMNHFVGNPTLPSLNPEMMLGYSGKMTFHQRLFNTLFSTLTYLNHNFVQYPSEGELVHKYISKDIDLDKVQYNVSLVLSNSHPSLNAPAASVPCMKEIAGFHVRPPKKLPDELQKYLDESKNGVIYFSMGSNVKSAGLPLKTRNALMNAFAKRKENVLWKFEDDKLPGKPDNVRIEKWLPQSDLLAHPNIKLFITHGGFLSTVETVYNGVPTVAIPILGDQMQNAKQAEKNGFTKVIEFASLTEEIISAAIDEVITNKKYRENVKARSKIFHDRQVKPLDEAVYWIEYIVRHNGAMHLRVGYLDLAWYQYYLLDVLAFIFAVIFVIYYVIKRTLGWIFCKIFKRENTATKSSKKVKKQ